MRFGTQFKQRKKIEAYCKKLLDFIIDSNFLKVNLMKAVDVFQESTTYWTKNMNRSYDGRKDVQEFTNILLDKCTSEVRKEERPAIQEEYSYGEVVKVINDRNGYKCGFIRRPNGDVFFHSKQNTQLDFNGINKFPFFQAIKKNPFYTKLRVSPIDKPILIYYGTISYRQ